MSKSLSSCALFCVFFVTFSYTNGISGPPSTWDRSCLIPSLNTCLQYPGAKFPSTDINFYYICGENGQVARVRCFCDRAFDMKMQQCVPGDQLTTISCDSYENSEIRLCDDDECVRSFYENFDKLFGTNAKITKEDVGNYLKMMN